MTRIDIISGFLGAGKTTLIKKLLGDALKGQQVVLIENEFGEIGIDGGFLKESGIQINELNAGCICCSLVGDFRTALQQVVEQYHPDRSGTGDVIAAIIAGMYLNGHSLYESVKKAADYVSKCIRYCEENEVPSYWGLCFEMFMKDLTEEA